jgi:hypothetical protein
MTSAGRTAAQGTLDLPVHLNEDYDWDTFDPQDYFLHNYESMRGDDATMLGLVRDWFAQAVPPGAPPLAGIDVGSGANLYPMLALLPYCREVTLYEYSRENVEWLESAIRKIPESWQSFWQLLRPSGSAEDFEQVRAEVQDACRVECGSIFDLPRRRWELGTMFFVAESLTEDLDQFDLAIDRFIGSLKPGAPFAAAFMECSEGYDVGEVHFPAVSIDEARLRKSIDSLGVVGELEVHHVEIEPAPLRPGYTGYLVAIGKVQD